MLRRLRIGLRLAFIALSFGLPMTGALVYVLLRGVQKDIDFGAHELEGTRYQRPLFALMVALAGPGDARTARALDDGLAEVERVDGALGADLQTDLASLERRDKGDAGLARLREQRAALADAAPGEATDTAKSRLLENVHRLLGHVGDTSNLILDPDLDSYYMMDATNLALPEVVGRLQRIGQLARSLEPGGAGGAGAAAALRDEILLFERADLPRISADVKTALVEDENFYGRSETLQRQLPPRLARFEKSGAALVAAAREPNAAGSSPALARAAYDALEATASLWSASVDELDRLLGFRLADIRRSRSAALALAAAAAVLSTALAAAIARSITGPLRRSAALARRHAAGDLRAGEEALAHGAARDEIAELGGALTEMGGGLRRLLAQVETAVGSVEEAITSLRSHGDRLSAHVAAQERATEEISATAAEVARATDGVTRNVDALHASAEQTARGTAELGSSVSDTALRMDQLAAAIANISAQAARMAESAEGIEQRTGQLLRASDAALGAMAAVRASEREVSHRADETRSIAEAVAEEARRGEDEVSETVGAMEGIRDSFARVEQVIGELAARSSSIGEVVSVIDEVAAETTLLSLNASIIAAQAGEHGKPFGVVASEVAGLAERTAKSSREIGELVRAVRQEIQRGVVAVADGGARVEDGTSRSKAAGFALQRILERCGETVERAADILRAGVAQSERLGEVERAFGAVREGVSAIGGALEQHGSAREGVLETTDAVRRLGENVKERTVSQRAETERAVRAMAQVAEHTDHVREAVAGQRRNCAAITRALDGVRASSEVTAASAADLRQVLAALTERAARLAQELERFTV